MGKTISISLESIDVRLDLRLPASRVVHERATSELDTRGFAKFLGVTFAGENAVRGVPSAGGGIADVVSCGWDLPRT